METAVKNQISTFYIEITNACNLACSFCPYPIMERKKGVMDFDLFRKVVDELAEKEIASWICLHLMGEPTLHPQFFEMVKYLGERDLHVSLITNGSISAERVAGGLDGLKIACLQLSINSFGEEQYAYKGVKNLSYEDYVENQKRFIDLYTELNPDTPIMISYLLTQDKYMPDRMRFVDSTEETLDVLRYWMDYAQKYRSGPLAQIRPTFVSKAAYLGEMKILGEEDLNLDLKSTAPEPIFRISPTLFVYFKHAGTWHNQLLDDEVYVEKRMRGTCHILEKEFVVLWNGDCTFCCGDYEGKMALGNVRENTIEELLNSEKVRRIREDNRRLIFNQEICQVCKGTVREKETNRKITVERQSLLDRFKHARRYFSRHGSEAFLKKVISKL